MSHASQRVAALVPMRHHSERVRNKNFRPLRGRPLYAYILEALSDCPDVESIAVDTDSPPIKEGIESEFPHVVLIDRPEGLRSGEIPINEIIKNDLGVVKSDFILQTHSTNPMLSSKSISEAVRRFFDGFPDHDSLFSVTSFQHRLWDRTARPINHDPEVLLRTQDLDPLYVENSCLYLFDRKSFLERGNRIGVRPQLFEIESRESLDIDEVLDFQIAEFLLALRTSDA